MTRRVPARSPCIIASVPWAGHREVGTDAFVRSVRREGRYSDGGNLYLQVANGGKSWVFQYQRHGRQRDMGLGSARSVSLALARELRDDCHVKLARSLDPIEARNSAVLAARAE